MSCSYLYCIYVLFLTQGVHHYLHTDSFCTLCHNTHSQVCSGSCLISALHWCFLALFTFKFYHQLMSSLLYVALCNHHDACWDMMHCTIMILLQLVVTVLLQINATHAIAVSHTPRAALLFFIFQPNLRHSYKIWIWWFTRGSSCRGHWDERGTFTSRPERTSHTTVVGASGGSISSRGRCHR